MGMSKPTQKIEELQNILEAEARAYRQLIHLTQTERTALQAENLDELSAVTEQKQKLMEKVSAWEQVRTKVVAHLAREFNLSPDTSLLDLITHLDDTMAQRLSDIRTEFIQLVEQLLTLNHGNQLMLQTGLVRVESTFDYLSVLATPRDNNYTATGNATTASQRAGNMLNWQA